MDFPWFISDENPNIRVRMETIHLVGERWVFWSLDAQYVYSKILIFCFY